MSDDLTAAFGKAIRETALQYVEGDGWIAARGCGLRGIYKRADVLLGPNLQVGCSLADEPISPEAIANVVKAMRGKYGDVAADKTGKALAALEAALG
jgi:hypothetical protein